MESGRETGDAPIAYLLRHLTAGGVGSLAFGSLVLGFDLGGLQTLMSASPDRWLYMALLFFGLFITFGGVALAFGVMSLGTEKKT